ncbi:DNA-processing protein DprA [Pseudodesulfovibrio sp. zrk46]|uniref:DNA-processing protein DprA n=1 Tax=Pseudodesulfovibrio sp. zrk46 TaxID=2725288 RepID=UPI0014492396|nr:DNA-processing protein DprA [Pseudodesulfovibrio sp. zrk46]QJB57928.1 DNA-protecting protein DprA [Pseudodesulfovibrio sp. zrk46]
MDLQREFFACLALKHTPRLGPKVWKQLFSHFSNAYEAVQKPDSWRDLGVENHYIKSVVRNCRDEAWRDKAEAEFHAARKAGMDVVTWFDPRFPNCLKQLEDPPVMLYVAGDVKLFSNPGVAVVGARECTSLGLEAAGRISTQLSNIGITVVSGLALGIDRQAHLGGLRGIGSSIAVLGCGLDVDYPYDNLDVRKALYSKGLVVTEYGPGVTPRAGHFPYRNRLISALSLGVLVAEAAHNSGSLITARLAGEQGRDVFALPGPLGQPTFTGCHRLIKQGAALVENAEDILEILRYDFARELENIPDPVPVKAEEEIDESEVRVKNSTKQKKAANTKEEKDLRSNVKLKDTLDGAPIKKSKRPTAVEREDIVLNNEEKEVMAVLWQTDKVHIDTLGRELDWASAKISKVLIMLEMRGAVQQLPGMWYLAKEA